MTKLEQTLLKEVAALPKERREDVLAFARYLRLTLPGGATDFAGRFEKALKSIRARAKKLNVTEEEIAAEIRAVREEHARRS
jgi:hypothetical protein